MGGGLESRCVGRVYGADGAVHTTYAAALKTTTHPKKLGAENHMLQLNIQCS